MTNEHIADPPDDTHRKRRPRFLIPGIIAAVVLVAAVVVVAVLLAKHRSEPAQDQHRAESVPQLVQTCSAGATTSIPTVQDETSLSFHTGADDTPMETAPLECLLRETSAPEGLQQQMLDSRGVEQVQHAAWDGWDVYWSNNSYAGLALTMFRSHP